MVMLSEQTFFVKGIKIRNDGRLLCSFRGAIGVRRCEELFGGQPLHQLLYLLEEPLDTALISEEQNGQNKNSQPYLGHSCCVKTSRSA
jgi:hypothetical protein